MPSVTINLSVAAYLSESEAQYIIESLRDLAQDLVHDAAPNAVEEPVIRTSLYPTAHDRRLASHR